MAVASLLVTSRISAKLRPLLLKRFGHTVAFAAILQYNGWIADNLLSVKQAADIAPQYILAVDGLLQVFFTGKLKALWAIITGSRRVRLHKPIRT